MDESPISDPFDNDDSKDQSRLSFSSDMSPMDADTGSRSLAWLILGVGVIGCCLMVAVAFLLYRPDVQSLVDQAFPSFTPTPSRTPSSTPTASSTPTRTPTRTPTPTPELLTLPSEITPELEENFDSESYTWENMYADSSARVQLGRLILRSKNRGYIAVVLCKDCPIAGDQFFLQAEISSAKPTLDEYGLVFCSPGYGSVFYAFEIDPSGQKFHLTKHSGDDWTYPINPKFSNLIRRHPESNTLTVNYNQGEIKLYINGVFVGSYQEENPSTCRQIGFIVNDAGFDMIADNVLVYKSMDAGTNTQSP